MVLVEYGELEDREEEVDVAPPLAADILQAEAPSQYVARADRAEGLEGEATFDSDRWWWLRQPKSAAHRANLSAALKGMRLSGMEIPKGALLEKYVYRVVMLQLDDCVSGG